MNLSISGLLGEVEGSAGRLTRQVIENATDPIKTAGLEIVDAALRPASAIGVGLILKLVFGLLALVLLIAALGFGSAALYTYLASIEGRPIAGLIVGAFYLVLAGVSGFAMMKVPMKGQLSNVAVKAPVSAVLADERARTTPRPQSPQVDPAKAELDVKLSVAGAQASAIPFPDADELVAALGAAGFEREQAGLQAGLALARRMSPIQLAIIGAAAGFIGGRRMRTMF